ncbi:MAG: HAD-IIIA family hydrolase [Pseudomonadota bacterium]
MSQTEIASATGRWSCALFDRDGVLNQDVGYLNREAAWAPIAGSLEALAALSRAGIQVGICTNQSGIGRGLIAAREIATIHRRLRRDLHALGTDIACLRYCPHLPDAGCGCRKPGAAMLRDALRECGSSADTACFVGDSLRDMQAAQAAGVEPLLVLTGNGRSDRAAAVDAGVKLVFDDCAAAVAYLLGEASQ